MTAATALATFTYLWVEKPVRFGAPGNQKALTLVVLMMAAGFAGWNMKRGGIPPHLASFHLQEVIAASRDWGDLHGIEKLDADGYCWRSKGGSREDMVWWYGDSQMWQYSPRVTRLIAGHPETSRGALFTVRPSCCPVPNVQRVRPGGVCEGFFDAAWKQGRAPEFSTVVIAAQWSMYLADGTFAYNDHGVLLPLQYKLPAMEKFYAGLEDMLLQFRQNGKRVVLLLEIPDGPELDPGYRIARRFDLRHAGLSFEIESSSIPASRLAAQRGQAPQRFKEIGRLTGAEVIDPVEFMCHDGPLPAADDNGIPRYYNGSHLRNSFVRDQVRFFDHAVLKDEQAAFIAGPTM